MGLVELTPEAMSGEDREKFDRGAELLKHAQAGKNFDEIWVPIGEGLLAIRRTVMKALALTAPRGGDYNQAFGWLCARTPYSELNKVERSKLLYCIEHLGTITEMRASWTPSQRAAINHPTSMSKHLREFLNRAPEERAAPRRNASPLALLREKNRELVHDNEHLKEKIASLEQEHGEDAPRPNLRGNSSVAEMAASILNDLGRDKAQELAQAILKKVSARALH